MGLLNSYLRKCSYWNRLWLEEVCICLWYRKVPLETVSAAQKSLKNVLELHQM